MQVFKGQIITCDQEDNVFAYLVEDRGRILHIGNTLPDAFKGARVADLGAGALLPSFGDAHLHFSNWALVAGAFFDVRSAGDFSELGLLISGFAARQPKMKILAAFGASKHSVEEKRLITREELDAIYAERPLYIVCYDGHSSIANSKMIEMLPEKVKGLRGFNADSGHFFHEAYYAATDAISGSIPALTLVKCIVKGYDRLAENGISMIHAAEGIGFPGDMDVTMVSLIARARAKRDAFQTRLFFQTTDVNKVVKRRLPRIGGCFSTGLDGCFGAADAALREPYSDDPENRGILFYSDEEVIGFVREANRAGLQIGVHAIGDAAVDQAIRAFECAHQDFPRDNARHIIIHACLLSAENLEKCAGLDIGISVQPGFLISPLEPVTYLETILGERYRPSSPLRDIVRRGVHLSGGSDAPVTHPDPIEGIFGACNHPYEPDQSLTIQQALKMYTYEVAWASFDEQERGSLEEGKIADMVVLNKDPLAMEPRDLRMLQVDQLYISGKTYRPGIRLGSLILNGLLGRKMKI